MYWWQWALVAILLVAMYTDWRWHKIYNWLTFPALGLGLVAGLGFGGPGVALNALMGAGVGFGISLVLYVLGPFLLGPGAFGAGDVKLVTVIGAWLGFPLVLTALVNGAILGGLVAVGLGLRYGVLWNMLRNLWYMLLALFALGTRPADLQVRSALPPFPYGISLGLGAILALALPRLWGP